MEKKKFGLTYAVRAENLSKVASLAFELCENTGMEPEAITLPHGEIIPWNPFLADKFVAKGQITEEEFIRYSIEAENP